MARKARQGKPELAIEREHEHEHAVHRVLSRSSKSMEITLGPHAMPGLGWNKVSIRRPFLRKKISIRFG